MTVSRPSSLSGDRRAYLPPLYWEGVSGQAFPVRALTGDSISAGGEGEGAAAPSPGTCTRVLNYRAGCFDPPVTVVSAVSRCAFPP